MEKKFCDLSSLEVELPFLPVLAAAWCPLILWEEPFSAGACT